MMKIEECIPLHVFTHVKQISGNSPYVLVIWYLDHSKYVHCSVILLHLGLGFFYRK